jgi:predicted DNA-binding WGR domain protein
MRRFELKRGLSLRFWQVSVEGNHVTVTSGVAGTPAQPLTATFPTPEAALAEQERLVKERLSWGYVELDPGPVPPPPPEPAEEAEAAPQPAQGGQPVPEQPAPEPAEAEAAPAAPVAAEPAEVEEPPPAPEVPEALEVPGDAAAADVPAAPPPVRRPAAVRRAKGPSKRLMALPAQALALTVRGTGTRRVRRDAMAALVAQTAPEAPAWVASCLLDRDSVIRAMAEEYFARAPGLLDAAENGPTPPTAEVADRVRQLKAELSAAGPEASVDQLPSDLLQGAGEEDGASFWTPEALARPVLEISGSVVPVEAVRSLVYLLRDAPEPGPAAERWRQICTGGSLEAFAWSLVRSFLAAGAAPENHWAFRGLGAFGAERTCERLGQMAVEWNEEAARDRARAAVAALVQIGSDAALATLHRLPSQLGRGQLAAEAGQGLTQAADRRGLDPESLADRLVDTLGLGADGTRPLGPAASGLRAVLDPNARLVLQDASGHTLSRFPRATGEDPSHAQAEREWGALKAPAARLISEQVQRLERALASGRHWRPEDFLAVRNHPILRSLARGLVWAAGDPERKRLFTLDASGAPVDVRGSPVALPDSPVWLVHPLHLDEVPRSEWRAALAAAGRPQPFPQLDRPVYQLGPEEVRARSTSRVAGRTVSASKLSALSKRGWRLVAAEGEPVRMLLKPVGPATASLAIAPGLHGRTWIGAPAQTLGDVTWAEADALGPVEASELLLDLQTLDEAPGGPASGGGGRRAV